MAEGNETRGSLYEVMTQIEVAERLGFIEHSQPIEDLAAEVAAMLASLMKKYGSLRSSTPNSN